MRISPPRASILFSKKVKLYLITGANDLFSNHFSNESTVMISASYFPFPLTGFQVILPESSQNIAKSGKPVSSNMPCESFVSGTDFLYRSKSSDMSGKDHANKSSLCANIKPILFGI